MLVRNQTSASPASSNSSDTPCTPPSATDFGSSQVLHQRQQQQQQQPQPRTFVSSQLDKGLEATKPAKPKATKSRKRVNTAEKRATHNAIERQRREALNGRFLDLARLLPGLADAKRPSKAAIVNNSINHLNLQREARLLAARELRALLQERDTLLEEVNTWRSQQGLNPAESTGETEGVKEVMKVENEVFGEFDAGCIGGDMDEEDYGEMEASFIGSEGAIERSSISSHATSLSQGAQAQSFIDLAAHSRSASAASQYGPDFFTSFAGLNDQSLDTFTSSISDFSPAVTSQSPLSSASFNEHAPVPFGGVMPSDEKVASWAAETLYQHLQKQQNHAQVQHAVQQRSRGDGGLDGFEDLYAGLNPNTAALLANMAVQQPRTFAGQYIADQEEQPHKSYNVPAGPAHLFQATCFPPQNPLPLPAPASAFSSSAPAPGQMDVNAWRRFALNQYSFDQQPDDAHAANAKRRTSSAPQYAVQRGSSSFGHLNGDSQQQQAEPTMDELREAVRAGMGYGVSLAAGVTGSVGNNAGTWEAFAARR